MLIALYNLLEENSKIVPPVEDHISHNRVNAEGDLLEYYVKDAFCGSYDKLKTNEKIDEYGKKFSHLGSKNHPPDFMVLHGDAVEVKKKNGHGTSSLALNSSYPKNYLYKSSKRINKSAIVCEDDYGGWDKKDMLYAVGNINNDEIHRLWFVYGDCYCADEEVYEKIANTMEGGISTIPGVEFSKTKELGRVNKVDPLGITNLRIRGMWNIAHPHKVFSHLIGEENDKDAYVYLIMKKAKYDMIYHKPNLQKFVTEGRLEIRDEEVFDPNNPARKIDVKLFVGRITG